MMNIEFEWEAAWARASRSRPLRAPKWGHLRRCFVACLACLVCYQIVEVKLRKHQVGKEGRIVANHKILWSVESQHVKKKIDFLGPVDVSLPCMTSLWVEMVVAKFVEEREQMGLDFLCVSEHVCALVSVYT